MTSATDDIDESYDDLDDEGGLSGFWILIIFFVVVAAFAGIVWIAYQKGIHAAASDDSDLPMVAADPTPARETVELEPVAPARAEVEQELNEPPRRVVAEVSETADPLANFDTGETPAPADPTPTRTETPAPTPTPTPAPTRTAEATPTPSPAPTSQPSTTTSAPSTPVRQSMPSLAVGQYAVQVGAFGSRGDAMSRYSQLSSQLGNLVSGKPPYVQVADVNGRTYHRLWIGAYDERSGAESFCSQLSSRGVDCFVKQR